MQFQDPNITVNNILEFCGPLATEHFGDLNSQVSSFTSPEQAKKGSMVFVLQKKYLTKALECQASLVLAPSQWADEIKAQNSDKAWIFSPNVELLAQKVKKHFVFETPFRASWQGVHPTAVIDPTAQLAEGVTIGPYAVVAANCQIAENVFIGAHSVIEENVTLGQGTTIHPHVYVGHSCQIGEMCEVMPFSTIGSEGFGYAHDEKGNHYRIPHTGRVVLENDVHIGAGVAIDRGTLQDSVIGQGTKLDNQVHLAHNSVIGKNGLITAQMVMAGSSTIGDNFACGGKTAITGHVKITDNVQLAGRTGVNNDIRKPGTYGGFPPIPIKQALKVRSTLAHLPEMRKQINRILRKLFPEDFQ